MVSDRNSWFLHWLTVFVVSQVNSDSYLQNFYVHVVKIKYIISWQIRSREKNTFTLPGNVHDRWKHHWNTQPSTTFDKIRNDRYSCTLVSQCETTICQLTPCLSSPLVPHLLIPNISCLVQHPQIWTALHHMAWEHLMDMRLEKNVYDYKRL